MISTARAFGPRLFLRPFARQPSRVLYYVDTQAPIVALTIDDGPDPVATPQILDLLRNYEVRGTFFLISGRIDRNEALVQRIIAEHHEIGNHLTEDRASILLSSQDFERSLVEAHSVLSRFAALRWFRPGSGFYSEEMLTTARRHGYGCALGDVYALDPIIPSVGFISRFVLRNVRPGSVVILHDVGRRGERTVKALEIIVPELVARGLRLVTLSELVK